MTRKQTLAAMAALATAGALSLGAGLAQAHERGGPGGPGGMGGLFGPGPMQQMDFAALDADGSGGITVEDLQALAQARFAEADANGDGALDEAEVAARLAARIAERGLEPRSRGGVRWTPELDERQVAWMAEGMILRADADANGTLSADEVTPEAERIARLIERLDTDGDNAVSAEEFEAFAETRHAERHGRGEDGGRDGSERGHRWRFWR